MTLAELEARADQGDPFAAEMLADYAAAEADREADFGGWVEDDPEFAAQVVASVDEKPAGASVDERRFAEIARAVLAPPMTAQVHVVKRPRGRVRRAVRARTRRLRRSRSTRSGDPPRSEPALAGWRR